MSSPSTPSLPVSLNIIGLFAVRAGSRFQTTKSSGAKVFHQHYMTAVTCSNGQCVQAILRIYSPTGDQTLPDGTVVFAIAKAVFSPNRDAILDAVRIAAFPGNPAADTYEDNIPDFTVPIVIGLGHVSGSHHTISDAHSSRAFPVTVGDFIQDLNQTCTVECVYDGSTKRWASTIVPPANTCIQFMGIFRELSPTGNMRINLDNIILNVAPRSSQGASASVAASADSSASANSTPASRKRSRFSAFASESPQTPTKAVALPAASAGSSTLSTSADSAHADTYNTFPSTPSPIAPSIPSTSSPDVFSSPTPFMSMPYLDPNFLQYMSHMHQMQQLHQASANLAPALPNLIPFSNAAPTGSTAGPLPAQVVPTTSSSAEPAIAQPVSSQVLTQPASRQVLPHPRPPSPSPSTKTGISARTRQPACNQPSRNKSPSPLSEPEDGVQPVTEPPKKRKKAAGEKGTE
ncbi:hypothetical protein B0H11DRAFT_1890997 [Mycena galericulata]|nr:hypothetical protein B0H11DRAFT_1890997 [Mycena galericulata]